VKKEQIIVEVDDLNSKYESKSCGFRNDDENNFEIEEEKVNHI
jgi:hypothetical protein